MPIHNKKVKAEVWKAIGERFAPFDVQCQFCGSQDNLTLDHVIATASGGTDDPGNIQVLCSLCHSIKNLIRQLRMREMVEGTRGKENNTSRVEEYARIRNTF